MAAESELLALAKRHFGYHSLRPGQVPHLSHPAAYPDRVQLMAIEAAISGRDSLLLMATGSGIVLTPR